MKPICSGGPSTVLPSTEMVPLSAALKRFVHPVLSPCRIVLAITQGLCRRCGATHQICGSHFTQRIAIDLVGRGQRKAVEKPDRARVLVGGCICPGKGL